MVVHMNSCSYVKFYHTKKSKKSDRQDLQFLAILQAKKPCILCNLQDSRESEN